MAQNAPKDYYKTLGVGEKATTDEIKKAYRRLAKKYHPDATGGDKAKEAKFKEVGEAYETLSDEKKRADYDLGRKNPFAGFRGRGGHPGGGSPFGGGGRSVHVDLNDLFNRERGGGGRGGPQESFGDIFGDLFAGFGGAGAGAAAARERQANGRDITMRIDVDLPVAALGGEYTVQTPSGRWNVKVPAGIEDGQMIRVAGKGEAAPPSGGGSPGDLLLEVHVKPHPHFRRHGVDLEVDVPVTIDQAVLGAKVEVATLEGKATLTVPPGTSSGLKLRLKGKGMHLPPGRSADARPRAAAARGDLYAVIQITVPRDLPPRARELIEEFAKLTRK